MIIIIIQYCHKCKSKEKEGRKKRVTSSVVYTVYLMTTIVYITTVHDKQKNGQMAGFHTGFFGGEEKNYMWYNA